MALAQVYASFASAEGLSAAGDRALSNDAVREILTRTLGGKLTGQSAAALSCGNPSRALRRRNRSRR